MRIVELSQHRALTGGFYTSDEAARILRIDNLSKIKRWLGNDRGDSVIARQYGGADIGFYDLLELRFIAYFRRQGVSLQSIRRTALQLRNDLNLQHPFAMSDVKFVTDRKRIFALAAETENDQTLMEIVSGQHAMYDVIEEFLAKGIEFTTAGLAKSWQPDRARHPNVVLNPTRAHGQPVIDLAGVPTASLFSLYKAEHDYNAVAEWYEVDPVLVEQAVDYELTLAAA